MLQADDKNLAEQHAHLREENVHEEAAEEAAAGTGGAQVGRDLTRARELLQRVEEAPTGAE
jgi:hypothetical protein